ncbi:MAG: 7-cyano-7-deazaguanine synthase [Propionibacteriaceae bacterium]|nr:7-cyano-7-deazaguanine synthase [Propionibacteriaceae bacterium]
MTELARSRVLDFLFYGYIPMIPEDASAQAWHNVPVEPKIQKLPDHEIRRMAFEAFEASTRPSAASVNVVHLSGGNDSRAILAALLEHGGPSSVIAVTYGTPGTYDYEIPRVITKRAGVEHVRIDLSKVELTTGDLVRVADNLPRPIWLFGPWANRLVTDRFGQGSTYWSGYLGGPVTGSHQPQAEVAASWREALEMHAKRPGFGGASKLFPPSYSARNALPQEDYSFTSPLTLDEQVDFLLRQHAWIYQEHAVPGYCYRFPFCDPGVLTVFLNAGRTRRRGQQLYLSMLEERYPRLFRDLPHKDHMGLRPSAGPISRQARLYQLRGRRGLARILGRWGMFPGLGTNHLDWNQVFRRRADFAELAQELLPNLRKRRVTESIDPVLVYADHRAGRSDNGLFLTQLISLETWLESGRGGAFGVECGDVAGNG